jgi:hypothetical protein
VAVQAVDAAERRGIIEVTTANLGDVRASLFRAQLVHCFVTEDQFGLSRADLGSLRANGDCAEEPVFFRNAQIDAKTTQTWATVWRAPRDRSLAILAVESYYVRGDRMRLEDATREQDAAPGCQGAVTTYRLQPDTRFKGVVQPARLLTYDQASFYLGYEGAGLCDAENDRELVSELGVRFITVRRSDWLGDEVRPD